MKIKYSLSLISTLFFIFSCNNAIGSGGTYKEFKGKATITKIENKTEDTCKDGVQIYFDFKPDNPEDSKTYRFPNFSDNNVEMYYNSRYPSRVWVERKGIKIGNVYNAKRSEIITGTSSPYMIQILEESVYPYQRNADGSYEDICK